MAETPRELLPRWTLRDADEAGRQWLQAALRETTADPRAKTLFVHIGFAGRKLGRSRLSLTEDDERLAEAARPGWCPHTWTLETAARVGLLLALRGDPETFAETLHRLCSMADVQELVAYYRGLPLYPEPARFRTRAAEGLRTNMSVVFEAVAHHNPYPAEQLDEGAWNQMILKALFIGSRLAPIQGLERRANPRLTRMLCDYAHERWAAHRPVSPELWRCVGASPDPAALQDLWRASSSDDAVQRDAAALALHDAGALEPRSAHDETVRRIEDGSLSWETLG